MTISIVTLCCVQGAVQQCVACEGQGAVVSSATRVSSQYDTSPCVALCHAALLVNELVFLACYMYIASTSVTMQWNTGIDSSSNLA